MSHAPSLHISGHFDLAGQRLFGPLAMTIPASQWTCILGASGVGKSTLLRTMLGLDTGATFTGRLETSDMGPIEGRASYMAQSDLLLPWLTVRENIILGANLRATKPDMKRAELLLNQVGLAEHQHKKPSALSGGMRQRAALARTLMEDRPIVFLDEPFSALDAGTRADMQELAVSTLSGKTVILITHDPSEAVRLGHKIIVLSRDVARVWNTPPTAPLRSLQTPDHVACQADLLDHLRGNRP